MTQHLEQSFATKPCFTEEKWLNDLREKMFSKFLSRGFPSRKEETWRYTAANIPAFVESHSAQVQNYSFTKSNTNMAKIVFVNGHYFKSTDLPAGVVLLPLSEAIKKENELVKFYLQTEYDAIKYPYAALNTAFMSDGIFLYVPKNLKITTPIHLEFIHTENHNYMTSPRNIIVAEENSSIALLEEHRGETAEKYLTNVVTALHAHRNSRIYFYKVQHESMSAKHFANIFVEQQQESFVKVCQFSVGGQFAREDLTVLQREPSAETALSGFYFLQRDAQHVDHHVHVDHFSKHGKSEMIYKGILHNKSQAVFNGKVHVHPGAEQINAHQANHNLLLSPDAQVNTKPELEIYADNIKCTHGATVGQLDAEALFFLRSRGLSKTEALKLLTRAFAEEIMDKIENSEIKNYIAAQMRHYHEI